MSYLRLKRTVSRYLSLHCLWRSWEAIYKVIPDEQPLIESTLKDLVRCGLSRTVSCHQGLLSTLFPACSAITRAALWL